MSCVGCKARMDEKSCLLGYESGNDMPLEECDRPTTDQEYERLQRELEGVFSSFLEFAVPRLAEISRSKDDE